MALGPSSTDPVLPNHRRRSQFECFDHTYRIHRLFILSPRAPSSRRMDQIVSTRCLLCWQLCDLLPVLGHMVKDKIGSSLSPLLRVFLPSDCQCGKSSLFIIAPKWDLYILPTFRSLSNSLCRQILIRSLCIFQLYITIIRDTFIAIKKDAQDRALAI